MVFGDLPSLDNPLMCIYFLNVMLSVASYLPAKTTFLQKGCYAKMETSAANLLAFKI
jgi:hypothetical protein